MIVCSFVFSAYSYPTTQKEHHSVQSRHSTLLQPPLLYVTLQYSSWVYQPEFFQELRGITANIVAYLSVVQMLIRDKDDAPEQQLLTARKVASYMAKTLGKSPKDLPGALQMHFDNFGRRLGQFFRIVFQVSYLF